MSAPTPDVKAIFLRAIEIGAPAERAAFLDEACARDARLREEVDSLLRAHEQAGSFLAPAAGATAETGLHQPPAPEPAAVAGSRIGPYKLLRQVGEETGMGVVYEAEQEQPPHCRVAVKVIKPDMVSAQIIARFEVEWQALALMDHPNIAKFHHAGTTESGQPYFAMDFVPGVPITKYCDDNRLTPRERLELFVAVCHAIQHAHQKGIIHRDVKPSNVLVTEVDGRAVPKVIDFGIAKAIDQRLTDLTLFTEYGAAVGTLEYMSPEQADVGPLGVDTRSDVYSLGVVLYELLTGTTPLEREKFRQAGLREKLRMIKEDVPRNPSTRLLRSDGLQKVAAARKTDPAKLPRLLKDALDSVVMKCLQKERNGRYETANALARDVQRTFADEPVEAKPPTLRDVLSRLMRKYRKAVLAGVAFVLLLLTAVAVSSWLAVRATNAERQMQAERDRTQQALVSQVVERLEGEVRQLQVLGKAMQATLEARERWTENEVKNWLVALLHEEERVRSVSVAFEPGRLEGRPDCCPYVSRGPRGIIEVTELLPTRHSSVARRGPRGVEYLEPMPAKAYTPNYREWDWYRKPFRAREPLWLGPGPDLGDWTVSYCVPFRLQGEWAGVLTVDLSVEYFRRVWDWLDKARLGQKSYGFVIAGANTWDGNAHGGNDRTGTFIGHPEYRPPQTILEVADQAEDPAFADLTRRMLSERQGSGTAIDPWTGRRSTFLFGRVPSAGWTFVAVIEQ